MELLTACKFYKNVLPSPNQTHLAIDQHGANLLILDVIERQPLKIKLLNDSNSVSWFPFQVDRAGAIAVASNNRPIVLYNSETCKTVCHYVPFNSIESIDSPLSIDFTADGSSLVAGGFECLRLFNVQRPGSEHSVIKLSESRASRNGIKGRVSSLCLRKDPTNLAAIGTFNHGLGILDLRSEDLLFQCSGAVGSVLQLAFSLDGWSLFSYSRKESHIKEWDLRSMNLANTIDRPNMEATNQRLHFGCLKGGGLAFGDCLGNIYVHRNGERVVKLDQVHQHPVTGVACFDDDSLVSCCGDRLSSSESTFNVVKTILN